VAVSAALLLWLVVPGLVSRGVSEPVAGEGRLSARVLGYYDAGGRYCVYVVLHLQNVGSTRLTLEANTSFYMLTGGGGWRLGSRRSATSSWSLAGRLWLSSSPGCRGWRRWG